MRKRDTDVSEGVTVVRSVGEVEDVLNESDRHRVSGATLIERALLRSMRHAGLFASGIFNPFGPTIYTVTLSYFPEWENKNEFVLLFRRLHPFTDDWIQVLARVWLTDRYGPGSVGPTLTLFIAGNGTSAASRSWAEPLYAGPPSGVIVPAIGDKWMPAIRRGHAWLFDHPAWDLDSDIARIESCGADFWKQASAELDDPNRTIAAVESPTPRGYPTKDDLVALEETPRFTYWWDLVTQPDYQRELYTQLPGAWFGAIGQNPTLALLNENATSGDDFLAWWRLFGDVTQNV